MMADLALTVTPNPVYVRLSRRFGIDKAVRRGLRSGNVADAGALGYEWCCIILR